MAATANAREVIGEATLGELESTLRGRLIRPSDPDYDQARLVWNAAHDRRPALASQEGTFRRPDLIHCRTWPYMNQAAPLRRVRRSRAGLWPLGGPPGAPPPSHPERSDDLIGSRHRTSSADRRVSSVPPLMSSSYARQRPGAPGSG